MLIGVDDMDVFKGIELKLLAVERVLDHHPEWRGRLTLVQVTNAPRSASWRLPARGRLVCLSWLHSWPMGVLCGRQVQGAGHPCPIMNSQRPGLQQQEASKRCPSCARVTWAELHRSQLPQSWATLLLAAASCNDLGTGCSSVTSIHGQWRPCCQPASFKPCSCYPAAPAAA